MNYTPPEETEEGHTPYTEADEDAAALEYIESPQDAAERQAEWAEINNEE